METVWQLNDNQVKWVWLSIGVHQPWTDEAADGYQIEMKWFKVDGVQINEMRRCSGAADAPGQPITASLLFSDLTLTS